MLFERRFWEPVAAGEVTVTFRRWRRPQATVGRTYRTPNGRIEVTAVDTVTPAAITDADARAAGYLDVETLLSDLRGDPTLPITRVAFRPATDADPRAVLAGADHLDPAEVADLQKRLARMDARASGGPWTGAFLTTIAERPRVRAGDLADALGWERLAFKANVRKLKELGLTVSHEVGYELSPRGRAFLEAHGTGSGGAA